MVEYIIGIDPAPSKTGMSVLSLESYGFETFLHELSPATSNHFHVWADRACLMSEKVVEVLNKYQNYWIVMETPPSKGTFAPALNALDTVILSRIPEETHVFLCSPKRIHSLLGRMAKGKGELKDFMFRILEKNEYLNFPTTYGRTKSDISDATLLLMWVFYNQVKKLELPMERPDMHKRWNYTFKKIDFISSLKEKEINAYV